jgi:hypothetical protein
VKITEQNGVQALMMISLVHSVDRQTKLLCIIALSNLLDANTAQYMINEGIVECTATLAKSTEDDEAVIEAVPSLAKASHCSMMNVCIQIFNHLTLYPNGCEKIVEKNGCMSALRKAMNSDDQETRILSARTTCNLVVNNGSRNDALKRGALSILEAGTRLNHDEADLHCIKAIFAACIDNHFLPTMAIPAHAIHMLLGRLALNAYGDKYDYSCKIISVLAWCGESRRYLQNKEFLGLVIELINKNIQTMSLRWLSLSLGYLSLNYPDYHDFTTLNAGDAIAKIHQTEIRDIHDESLPVGASSSIDMAKSSVTVFRVLSETSNHIDYLANPDYISVLKRITQICDRDAMTIYDVGVTIMKIAFYSSSSRQATSIADTMDIFDALSRKRKVRIDY